MRRIAIVIAVVVGLLALPGVIAGVLILTGAVERGDPMTDHAGATPGAADASLEPEIAYAMAQRHLFGLRADEAWVRQVAADPTARVLLLDFPMTRDEEQALETRNADLEETANAVQAYGDQHPDTFGGVWADEAHGRVVAAWTRDAELQRIALMTSLGRFAPIEARTVRHSMRELAALQDRIDQDMAWFITIPASFQGSGQMTMENRVELWVSSAVPDAQARIMEHFGVGADILTVVSDGTGIALHERGTVSVHVVDVKGRDATNLDWNVAWTSDRPVGGGDCGEMAGIVIGDDGRFDLACPPGGWTILIQERDQDGVAGWADIGAGHVVVPEGGTVDLEIRVEP